jgi:DNA polymerase/3'-5' exonuclease PolX
LREKDKEKIMVYSEIIKIAEATKEILAPHCERIEIAGSVRRKKADCGDIEIVCIPKPYGVGLFASGLALACQEWPAIKGEFPCKYTQRILPCKIKLDLFTATKENWGLIYAIRTGSADFSHNVLACGWVRAGLHSKDGTLFNQYDKPIPIHEEKDLFDLIGIKFIEPEKRI